MIELDSDFNFSENELIKCISSDSLDFILDELVANSKDSTSSDIVVHKKPKRIRNRRPGVVIFPRVVKIDIRRKYPLMFINMANSLDPKLTARFFTQFCLPNCQLIDTTLTPVTLEAAVVKVHNGLPEILQFCQVSELLYTSYIILHM